MVLHLVCRRIAVRALCVVAACLAALGAEPAPRRDRYGDPLPAGAVARLGTVRLRHGIPVRSLAFARDGRTLVSAGNFGGLGRWEAATGKPLPVCQAPGTVSVWQVAFSPDGRTAALGGTGMIHIWDYLAGKELRSWKTGPSGVLGLAFSPDGKRLASLSVFAHQDLPRVWDPATGRELWHLPLSKGSIDRVCFSPDGRRLATGGSGHPVCFWDAATGKKLLRLEGDTNRAIYDLAFSPAGGTLASADNPGGVRVWDARTGKLRRRLTVPDDRLITRLAFSPDGKCLAVGGEDGLVRLVDPATGKDLGRCQRHCGTIDSLAFSPDGGRLASGGWDNCIRLWDLGARKELLRREDSLLPLGGVAFTADGKGLALATADGTVRVWDPDGSRQRFVLRSPAGGSGECRMAPGAAGSRLAVGYADGSLCVWDVSTGRLARRWSVGKDRVHALASPRDGRFLVVSAGEWAKPSVCCWEGPWTRPAPAGGGKGTGGMRERPLLHDRDSCFQALALTPDGNHLAVAHLSTIDLSTIYLWPMGRDRDPVRLDRYKFVVAVALSPDGKVLASANMDRSVSLWDTVTGKRIRDLGPEEGGGSLAFSPDGALLAVGGLDDAVRVWDLARDRVARTFRGHAGWITGVAFSPDGRTLASASSDSTAVVWDLSGLRRTRPDPVRLAPGELKRLWGDLAGENTRAAERAVWRLVGGGVPAVAFIEKSLPPIATVPEGTITRWIVELDDESFAVRSAASRALEAAGEQAEPALRKALAGRPPLEVRRRVEALLKKLEPVPFRLTAVERRHSRAVRVLELHGSPEARRVLKALAGGADRALLTREARAALARPRSSNGNGS